LVSQFKASLAVFVDDFDFNTNEGSVPRKIASLIGSAMFREYRWNATTEFLLTIPCG
jgi:hypothetical protein